jgi:hypothetical protein
MFANYTNVALEDQTVSEVIAATTDGKTLAYTDVALGNIGFIDITNPVQPGKGHRPHRSTARRCHRLRGLRDFLKTSHKIFERYQNAGLVGLTDRSRQSATPGLVSRPVAGEGTSQRSP